MAIKVGITGGIASGKTTCTSYIHDRYSIPVIDADLVSREIVSIGSPALVLLVETLGKNILHEDGSLNRKLLRNMLLEHETIRLTVNRILHPLIRKRMLEHAQKLESDASGYIIFSIPLLFETSWNNFLDITILIDLPESIQIMRLMKRDNYSYKQAQKMLMTQYSREIKIQQSNYIIDNSSDFNKTKNRLDKLHMNLLRLGSFSLR